MPVIITTIVFLMIICAFYNRDVTNVSKNKSRRLSRAGYMKDENGKLIYKIRAKEKYGRKLRPHEQVHHVDGNKSDNSNSNLWIATLKYHNAIHRKYKNWYPSNKYIGWDVINKYLKNKRRTFLNESLLYSANEREKNFIEQLLVRNENNKFLKMTQREENYLSKFIPFVKIPTDEFYIMFIDAKEELNNA